MTYQPAPDDEAIRAMLERRAARSRPTDLLASVRTLAEVTPQRRSRPAWTSLPRREVLAGVVGLAAVLAIALTIGLSAGLRLSGGEVGSPTPSTGAPSSGSSVAPGAIEPVLPLTVDQLNDLMAANLQSLLGRQLVISGNLVVVPQFGRFCAPGTRCSVEPAVALQASSPTLFVLPAPENPVMSPWVDGNSVVGTFAATLTSATTLTYLGRVTTGAAGVPLLPSELPSPAGAAGLWLVHGWIVSPAIDPACGTQLLPTPGPASGPGYGCGQETLLSNVGSQPGPSRITVQNDAYLAFGPWPSTQEQGAPHEATFLLEAVQIPPCRPTQSCPTASSHWAITARLDPWTQPAQTTQRSIGPVDEVPPVLPLSVAQLNELRGADPSLVTRRMLVINGTVEGNPSTVSCPYAGGAAPRSGFCAPVVLAGSVPILGVQVGPNVGGGAWTAGGSDLIGSFAAKLVDPGTIEYLGPVITAADGQPLLPSQLPNPALGPPYSLVHGWIAGETEVKPCPYVPGSRLTSGPQYGCGRTAILSDQRFQPVQRDAQGTTFAMPTNGIRVQNDAYQDFAPQPQAVGPQSVPQQATFLVQGVQQPQCSPGGTICTVGLATYGWAIVARLDSWLTEPSP